jgi:plastocyanin
MEWINRDTDDHTVVSDDAFDTADHRGTNHLLPGTDSNGGQPGRFVLRFDRPGTFVYYCRFHAHLDASTNRSRRVRSAGSRMPTATSGRP